MQVIIVGNVADQVKFSELTLDMFRMLQTLEREPQDEMAQVQTQLSLHMIQNFLSWLLCEFSATRFFRRTENYQL